MILHSEFPLGLLTNPVNNVKLECSLLGNVSSATATLHVQLKRSGMCTPCRSALCCPTMPKKSLCEVLTHWCVVTQQNTYMNTLLSTCVYEQRLTGATLGPALSQWTRHKKPPWSFCYLLQLHTRVFPACSLYNTHTCSIWQCYVWNITSCCEHVY